MASLSYFEVYQDDLKQWQWRLKSKNGQTIAVSYGSYQRLVDCEHSITLVKQESPYSPAFGDVEHNSSITR
ncbi:DUF1508 domain-containing protein [Photobacterium sp. SP02]|uniref:YegP family protein n=1 Tax=Photobacterium sp. SP02 TaxID=3032280 RepID=UPI0031453D6F